MTAEAPASADRRQNARVLVSAASLHGATAEIGQAIGHVLSEQGFATTVMAPGDVNAIDDYDAVVIGSAAYVGEVRYGQD
jgi:menaquinone-dependent protoporphyrinogen oxidase